MLQILRLSILINNQRSNDLDLDAFKLILSQEKFTKVTLAIDKLFVENNRLILLDLEQEQKYWKAVNNWKLSIETF